MLDLKRCIFGKQDAVRQIKYLDFTQCKDSRVAAASKDGFVLVHDDCKRMFFVVVNKSLNMAKKIVEYYA